MTTEEHIIKLVVNNPNYADLGKKVAIYIRKNFLEEINKELAKNKK